MFVKVEAHFPLFYDKFSLKNTHNLLHRYFHSHLNFLIHFQSYFSEPEFDSEYQHQHIHKGKVSKLLSIRNKFFFIDFSFLKSIMFHVMTNLIFDLNLRKL